MCTSLDFVASCSVPAAADISERAGPAPDTNPAAAVQLAPLTAGMHALSLPRREHE